MFQAPPEQEPPAFSSRGTNEGIESICRIKWAAETKDRLKAEGKAFADSMLGRSNDTVRLTEMGVNQQVQKLRDGLMSQGSGEPSGTFQ